MQTNHLSSGAKTLLESAVLLSTFGLFSLTSCQERDTLTWEQFDLSSFQVCDMTEASYEVVSPDSINLAEGSGIQIVSDNLLAILDRKNKENVLCFLNPSTQQFAKTLSTGKSTKEVTYPTNIWSQDKSLFCYDVTGKILKIDCNPGTLETDISLVTKAKAQGMAVAPMAQGQYLMEHCEARYLILSPEGQGIDTIGVFPTEDYPEGEQAINSACQVEMATAPNLKHVVCVNRDWNKIEIYSGQGKNEHFLSGPIEIDAKIKRIDIPTGAYMLYQSPGYTFFRGVCTSNQGFMVGYIGLKEEDYHYEGVHTILSFDWNGKPLKMYTFKQGLTRFDYDAQSKSLFCIVQQDDKCEIIKYALN